MVVVLLLFVEEKWDFFHLIARENKTVFDIVPKHPFLEKMHIKCYNIDKEREHSYKKCYNREKYKRSEPLTLFIHF